MRGRNPWPILASASALSQKRLLRGRLSSRCSLWADSSCISRSTYSSLDRPDGSQIVGLESTKPAVQKSLARGRGQKPKRKVRLFCLVFEYSATWGFRSEGVVQVKVFLTLDQVMGVALNGESDMRTLNTSLVLGTVGAAG